MPESSTETLRVSSATTVLLTVVRCGLPLIYLQVTATFVSLAQDYGPLDKPAILLLWLTPGGNLGWGKAASEHRSHYGVLGRSSSSVHIHAAHYFSALLVPEMDSWNSYGVIQESLRYDD